MNKVFIDTDVILDFLLNRKPFSMDAARILSLSEKKVIWVGTTGLVFANAYYILRKLSTHKNVVEKLTKLSDLIKIIDLPKDAVMSALKSDFRDFEDAIQNFSAIHADVKVLITRNSKDFKTSSLAVMSPDMFLSLAK
ncbi:PIN domain-containing protein [Anseongella ginsenosidimutans]|uniref:PIN domain-containing protein n=1 Tax=Anseongella ginsenosidimutans TaxID=496056 RepID=A0A4V2UTH0_9SPHI|nr:PIN domain-containing protein [Anseongella ginsenosidimutans]QEC52353.1 PIN domain-containing protein [Anseongella ginsenosidimutans]TCS85905.1 PIN domain-containing protein [Anseongella ginsenosidimutans]